MPDSAETLNAQLVNYKLDDLGKKIDGLTKRMDEGGFVTRAEFNKELDEMYKVVSSKAAAKDVANIGKVMWTIGSVVVAALVAAGMKLLLK